MKVHHLRNATMVIESGDKFILVDPMLGEKGTGMPFTLFRFKPQKNPIINLPEGSFDIINKATHCLITHLHPDHIDEAGFEFLKNNRITVICSSLDEKVLRKKGLNVQLSLDYWLPQIMEDFVVTGVPAIHGYGFVTKITGNVMGFMVELKNDKSIYISADTVYTNDVDKVLKGNKPDLAVFAAGIAQMDIGKPLLMDKKDIVKFIKNAPGAVLANHMEALNHCPNSRKDLKELLGKNKLLNKVSIPDDGDTISL